MKKRIFVKVYGQVTGVGFRYSVCEQAKKLGVAGWVRNYSDGTVEIEAEAEEEKLKELLEWVKKGPRYASVKKVEVEWREDKREFVGFKVEY